MPQGKHRKQPELEKALRKTVELVVVQAKNPEEAYTDRSDRVQDDLRWELEVSSITCYWARMCYLPQG